MENHDQSKRRRIAESFTESNGVIINPDITENVLSRIPIEFVSRSRAVCKLWRSHLKKPKTGFLFTGLDMEPCYGDEYSEEEEVNFEHLSVQSLTKINHGLGQDRYSIYGSCNGLVCFPDYEKDKLVYICNPMTGEYVYLPEMDSGGTSEAKVYSGFGYSTSTNEYKVVQVYYIGSVGRVQVYTLGGGNVWRYKGEVPFIFKEQAVFANNSLYWLDRSTESQFDNIIAFDLTDETFSSLPLPPCFGIFPGYNPSKLVNLTSLRGSLGVYHVRTAHSTSRYSLEEDKCMDIWILNKEKEKKKNYKKKTNKNCCPFGYSPVDENDDSNPWVWIWEYSMKYECFWGDPVEYEPFAITRSNQILLWGNQWTTVFCYDPNTLTLNQVWDTHASVARAIPHMNSFVSLKDLGESGSMMYALDDSKHKPATKRKVFVTDILGSINGLIKNLNLDITENILSHIPIERVSLGRAVCRLWNILLKKPKPGLLFAVLERLSEDFQIFHGYNEEVSIHEEPISHKTLAKIDLGFNQSRDIPVKLIKNVLRNPIIFGSCNGLVCFPVEKNETKCLVYICNPMTGEYVYLPEIDSGEISRPEVLGGFGYCKSTNEYKVVQVSYRKKLGIVQVYTLGGSGWRNKGEISFTPQKRLIFANEALYWRERIEDVWNIKVFYLADETFGTLPMPPCHDVIRGYKDLIVSLSGNLCVYHDTVEKSSEDPEEESDRKEDKRMDIWILKKEQKKKKKSEWYFPVDENDDSNLWVWIREISMKYKADFHAYTHYEPFTITSNNQVLMWEDCYVHDYKVPICYDPNTISTKSLWNMYVWYAHAVPHISSFVSLEDLGEKSAKYIPESR